MKVKAVTKKEFERAIEAKYPKPGTKQALVEQFMEAKNDIFEIAFDASADKQNYEARKMASGLNRAARGMHISNFYATVVRGKVFVLKGDALKDYMTVVPENKRSANLARYFMKEVKTDEV